MQLKNLATGVALPLPDDLLWTDEHAWTPAVASTSYLVTGALLVQSAVRQAGRPITLAGAIDMAWVKRATVAALYEWAAVPLGVSSGRFELTLADSRVFEVAFRHAETPVEAARRGAGGRSHPEAVLRDQQRDPASLAGWR